LATVRASQIRSALEQIVSDFGRCDLSSLRAMSESEALSYLESLAGVSGKVARCILLYTMNGELLPVRRPRPSRRDETGMDTRKRADQCHESWRRWSYQDIGLRFSRLHRTRTSHLSPATAKVQWLPNKALLPVLQECPSIHIAEATRN